ncbi:MAG: helix-turn-helix transcriptional regulator [bacterium]
MKNIKKNNKNYPARNNIWLERQKKNFSQKQLAYIVGEKDGSSSLSHMEKGDFIPSLINALRLSIALSTPVEAIFQELCNFLQREIEPRRNKINQLSGNAEGMDSS